MTATHDTTPTVHVDVPMNLPLEDGGTLRVRQGIGAIRTQTEGLVVFPVLIGPYEVDDSRWSVTHVGTGLRIPVAFDDEEHATAFANAAGPLACWWQKKPKLPLETRLKLVRLAQEHGGTPDQKALDALARHDSTTKES
ncbi:hypothetical protein [Streptomyces sp. NBC_00878]|uniref:hypothetical protein n=1 Tax=Streptomyces sp. NBC_00878 TaxID=2975854 RepID=UPI002258E150|nr:hypothetical protein [Streptomyces sp. NBC_00878]MCX4911869.1 hypothetical protein [Streptomyces sp. NBC_00878]